MTQETPRQSSAQATTELAKERNRAAAERTLMAWIRTCLSMISFGFGLEIVGVTLAKSNSFVVNSTRLVGISLILLGIYAMYAATVEHQRELRRIESDFYFYTPRRSLSMQVSVVLILIGITAIMAIAMGIFLQ
jgi:putative membrane protein